MWRNEMRYEDYLKQRHQDPEYQVIKKDMKPLLDLADDLLRERLKRGWSQSELARRAGTKQSNISKLEAGLSNPTYEFLKKVADALEVDLIISFGKEEPIVEQKYIHYTAKIVFENLPWGGTKRTHKNLEFEFAQRNK